MSISLDHCTWASVEGRHLVTSPPWIHSLFPFPWGLQSWCPFSEGESFLSQFSLSLSIHFLIRKVEIRGNIHRSCGNVPENIVSHAFVSPALNSYSEEASITFAMATTPCTFVKLHLTSFPLMIFSWICPSHGQKACNSHSEFCLYGQKLKAKPA